VALPELAIGLISFGPVRKMADSVAACARHGIRQVGLTRELVAATGLAEAARILSGEGMTVTGYARAPRIPPSGGPARAQALSEGRRLLDEAATIGARHLIATGGGFDPAAGAFQQALEAFVEGMQALLPEAATCGVEVVIEPLHPMYAGDRGLVFTLARALDLCDALGLRRGLVVDAYHVWWEPGLAQALAVARGRIAEFHICDWRLPTRGPTDRAMIGEGCIDLRGLAGLVRATGFDGPCELELFSSEDWWLRSPDEVLATAITNFAALFQDPEARPMHARPAG
jgi:sugar phosphate isomerase/epimerase